MLFANIRLTLSSRARHSCDLIAWSWLLYPSQTTCVFHDSKISLITASFFEKTLRTLYTVFSVHTYISAQSDVWYYPDSKIHNRTRVNLGLELRT